MEIECGISEKSYKIAQANLGTSPLSTPQAPDNDLLPSRRKGTACGHITQVIELILFSTSPA